MNVQLCVSMGVCVCVCVAEGGGKEAENDHKPHKYPSNGLPTNFIKIK